MSVELPPPKPSQPYVHASVLEAGHIHLPEFWLVDGGSKTKRNVVPSMAFMLRHSDSGQRIIFDLGLRKDWENYPPKMVQVISRACNVDVPMDVVDSLRRGGAEPHDVDTIILSHVHFDHIGDPALFPSSRFVVHDAARHLLAGGYDPADAVPANSEYTKRLLPESRTAYLPSDAWTPLGPFPRAHDFLGDGSVYLVDATGHCPGHINVLVRTSADGAWMFLAGDSAHDVRLITGEREIGMFPSPGGAGGGGMMCMHGDLAGAKTHIERIKQVGALPRVHVLLAHDGVWYEGNKDKGVLFPGEIPPL